MATHGWIRGPTFFEKLVDSYFLWQSVSPVLRIAPLTRPERFGFFDHHSLMLVLTYDREEGIDHLYG
jgi:hypothetical protein